MKYRSILLFGAPGSGKGTQGRVLGAVPGFYHFASGDVFRRLTPGTELGRLFLDYSSRGELVPDEPTIQLCCEAIEAAARDGRFDAVNDTLLLDGIPRNANQARILSKSLDVRLVLYLSCADMEKMVLRLQRRALKENRLDDADPAVIRNRLEVFESKSKPLLDFYGPELRCDIDATQTPLQVALAALQAVEERLA